jgi:hypothetical protein
MATIVRAPFIPNMLDCAGYPHRQVKLAIPSTENRSDDPSKPLVVADWSKPRSQHQSTRELLYNPMFFALDARPTETIKSA